MLSGLTSRLKQSKKKKNDQGKVLIRLDISGDLIKEGLVMSEYLSGAIAAQNDIAAGNFDRDRAPNPYSGDAAEKWENGYESVMRPYLQYKVA